MTSILTNNGAMVALQTLQSINNNLTDAQNQISTGKTIASAKDNSAVWAISKVMESDVAGFNAVSDSLALGEGTVDVALAGVEQISEILNDIKEKVVTATGENVDHTKIGNEITQLTSQVTQIIAAAQFNGTNLLNDSTVDGSNANLTVLSSLDRNAGGSGITAANITVAAQDFTSNLDLSDIDVSDSTNAEASLANIEAHIQTAVNSAATLGAAAARIEDQQEFVTKLSNAMKSGVGALVDTDMEEASARLKALQTQQQLGVQALSIANSAPQALQQLFR
ncbi:flagellin [Phaeobacter sp. PT47_59]|uniref:flagellin N-terminal helical domain-containing protein n=1 Tax=Phaeobacter sp. PT47_59 TaxID=3029979 RepID=UPI002380075D|nr:flagellin [Phaeobacter sp. PT47_59]MDE4172961.1 flagellin [Phaeobacter sp. PT47_59]